MEPGDGALRLARLPGRWRGVRHGVLAVPVALCGWAWLGSGVVLVLLWWWHRRPRAREAPAEWCIDPARVAWARLGAWRTRLRLRGAGTVDVFHDELSARDLALLRRTLKHQLATGWSTSSRSENPGKRMVSSERASRPG